MYEKLMVKGVIFLYKPVGLTSSQTLEKVKQKLGVKTGGYHGTLDANVDGVLIIAVGKITPVLQFISRQDKEYVGKIKFHKQVTEEQIKTGFEKFTGEIEQIPPVKSAVKRVLRKRKIYFFEFLDFKNNVAGFRVKCEAGTYIRKLCYDVGEFMGVGAQMLSLQRTASGDVKIEDCVKIEDLQESDLKPKEVLLKNYKKAVAKNDKIQQIVQGKQIYADFFDEFDKTIKTNETFTVYDNKNQAISMMEALQDFSNSNSFEIVAKIIRNFTN